MTAKQFRQLALSFSAAEEKSHQSHPDFRVGNKIFASLGYPDLEHGMLKLTAALQAAAMAKLPNAFRPAAGAWGRGGSTIIRLSEISLAALRPWMRQAYEGIR